MTSPRHAFYDGTSRGRHYRHPVTGDELISVTNAIGRSSAKYGIPPWYASLSTRTAWDLLPLMAKAARAQADCGSTYNPDLPPTHRDACRCHGCLTRWIRNAAERERDRLGDLGTRIHALAEAHLLGKPMPYDQEAAPYLESYERFLADFDVDITSDVESAELTVAHPYKGYAGTLDILLYLKLGYVGGKVSPLVDDRRRWLIDIKTSEKRAATQTFSDNALQLAALKYATEAWIDMPDGSCKVQPVTSRAHAAGVLNLRRGSYELVPLPTTERERDAFFGCLTHAKWGLERWPGDYGNRPVTPAGRFKPKRGYAVDGKPKPGTKAHAAAAAAESAAEDAATTTPTELPKGA